MHKRMICFLLFLNMAGVYAQRISIQEYIDTYKDIAIIEMKRMGVPASITLAQGILETENGNSDLVKKSNNHFGIKCKSSWSGGSVSHDDDANGECFRKYEKAKDSYRDHSNFLRGSDRYAFLFKLNPTDYKAWAYGLKKAGYATNPQYPLMLIKSIEDYNLNQYSIQALPDMPVYDASKYKDDEVVEISAINTKAEGFTEGSKLNGLKAVYADSGTSLLAIATRYNLPLSKLLAYNDLSTDGLLQQGSWMYLENKLSSGNRDSYTTAATENIYDIAQANGIQLSVLLQINGLKEGDILPPGKLVLLKTVKQGFVNESFSSQSFHEVQPKEGLYSISKKYSVTIDQIKEWNHLDSNEVKVGQKLIISK